MLDWQPCKAEVLCCIYPHNRYSVSGSNTDFILLLYQCVAYFFQWQSVLTPWSGVPFVKFMSSVFLPAHQQPPFLYLAPLAINRVSFCFYMLTYQPFVQPWCKLLICYHMNWLTKASVVYFHGLNMFLSHDTLEVPCSVQLRMQRAK